MKAQYSIHKLSKDDWQILKEIRLEALSLEPKCFGSDYEKESSYDETQWQEFIGDDKEKAIFILKDDTVVIGLTGILKNRAKPKEAMLVATYIRNEYRRKGLSKLLYEARLIWAKHERISSVIVSHRESNLASKMANQKFGFQYTGQQSKIWSDGLTEMEVFYRLSLS